MHPAGNGCATTRYHPDPSRAYRDSQTIVLPSASRRYRCAPTKNALSSPVVAIMTVRTTRKTVTFAKPFRLPAFEDPLPAGPCEVETTEEMLEGNNHTGFHRTATALRIQMGSAIEYHPIDPADLSAALENDQKAASLRGRPPAAAADQAQAAEAGAREAGTSDALSPEDAAIALELRLEEEEDARSRARDEGG